MKVITSTKNFYLSITHLFYALAMADKNMVIEEKKIIVNSIKKDWVVHEEFDSEELMYETMRNLIKETTSAEDAFSTFSIYYTANKEHFSKDIKHHLLEAAHKIAHAQAGKNKSELIFLAKLHLLFGKL